MKHARLDIWRVNVDVWHFTLYGPWVFVLVSAVLDIGVLWLFEDGGWLKLYLTCQK